RRFSSCFMFSMVCEMACASLGGAVGGALLGAPGTWLREGRLLTAVAMAWRSAGILCCWLGLSLVRFSMVSSVCWIRSLSRLSSYLIVTPSWLDRISS